MGIQRGQGIAARAGLLIALAVTAALMGAPGAGAAPSSHPFEIVPGSFHVSTATGQAGAHRDLTVSFDFAHEEAGGVPTASFNDVRTTVVELPSGLIGNNTAVPTCTDEQLVGRGGGQRGEQECPVASQVGTISLEVHLQQVGYEEVTVPIFNMEATSPGIVAQYGFNVAGGILQVLNARVRPGDSGITIESADIANLGEPRNVSVTTWGLPASPVHDPERGLECFSRNQPPCEKGGQKANIPVEPFLSNPTSCEPHVARLRSDSWEEPESWTEAQTEMTPASSECERVPFDASLEVQPTTRSAETSSGLNVSLIVPQSWENPVGLASAHLKDSVVTLPVGYTANPSLAAGLGACTPEQFERETASSAQGAGCPEESKIGTVDVETPVLVEKHLEGNIYIAKPFENPFGSLLGLYIVVKDPQRGIIVKLAGKIEPNETTGQLVTTFDGNPQVPFSKFTLKLRQGANSPLVSPPACGSFLAQAELTPWSEEEGGKIVSPPQLLNSPPFPIESGIGGGACPAGGVPPFAPGVTAGTLNNAAGSYSPFYLRIERHDGEQELTRFSTVMPPGLTGNLTGIPFCPDAAIAAAQGRTGPHGGALEQAEPSCPGASKIGHTIVEAGVGSVLAQTPGSLYLAGPYHGAPLSLVSVTSAEVGPFDLGTVVIRFALRINPLTAQVEVDATGSDPIPHIIKGIVVHVRNIRAYIDRASFILNPTSCQRMSIANSIDGANGGSASVSSPFQATDCATLGFKPSFKASTSGKTSRANGASLTAKLTVPAALGTQANIARVKVDLPKQLPSRLTTLQKACTAAQFNANPAGCPAASFIGHAKAITPILPVPLEGPAIFVSHGGEAFPSLEIVLQGYGVTIDLVGSTFISKAGITSSTFKTVPDQPVTSFELTLPEGKFSALAANGSLCASTKTVTVSKRVTRRIHGHTRRVTVKVKQSVATPLAMPTEFVAQNGAVIHQSTKISVTGCSKKAKKAKKAKGKGKGKKK
jgi:hypothetical protein